MKNINKIMFACMMLTVGSLSAIPFTVDINIPGYVAGMTGNFNMTNLLTGNATISDATGKVIFTSDSASAIDQKMVSLNQNIVNKYTGLIGSYFVPGSTPSNDGNKSTNAIRSNTTYNVYGPLVKNS